MSSNKSVASVLKEANLSSYLERFQNMGADDPEQVARMSESTFLQLTQHVGMSGKPFHVSRLLGVLTKLYGICPVYEMPAVPERSRLVYQGQPEFVTCANSALLDMIPKRRRAKPYYGEVQLPADEVFAEFTDIRSVEETQELVTELAAIYKSNKLNKYQQYINACASELAIRDPTLLARRGALLEKAREVNLRGGKFKFHRGFSSSKNAPEELNMKRMESNFTVANKHREQRLNDIRNLENVINNCIFQKEGLVERLKHDTDRDNKVAIGSVRSQLDEMEEQIYVSKKNLTKLKLAQRRSERYYTIKLSKDMSEEKEETKIENVTVDVDLNPQLISIQSPQKSVIKIKNLRKRRRSVEVEDINLDHLKHLDMITSEPSGYDLPSSDGNLQLSSQTETQHVEYVERLDEDILTDVFNSTISADLNNHSHFHGLNENYQ